MGAFVVSISGGSVRITSIRRAAAAAIAAGALAAGVVATAPAHATDTVDIEVSDFAGVVEAAQAGWSGRSIPLDGTAAATELAQAPEECLEGFVDDDLFVLRYAGANRYETAVCVSFWTWADHADPDPEAVKAEVVVLARGDRYEDALAGGPLAAYEHGPLLLTRPTSLRANVRAEIERVLAPGGLIYLLGGSNAISDDVRVELQGAGYQVKRVAGTNRYETSIEIAKELPDTSNFVLATGRNFPDALGAGTAAAFFSIGARETGLFDPFALLLTADDTLRPTVADFMVDRGIPTEGLLVTAGGWAERAVEAEFGEDSIAASFTGVNRYDTAAQIAEGIFTDFDTGELVGWGVGLSTGTNFPDALAATPMLAMFGQPLLLTRPNDLRQPTAAFLSNHAGEGGIPGVARFMDVLGGPNAVSDAVVDSAVAAFK